MGLMRIQNTGNRGRGASLIMTALVFYGILAVGAFLWQWIVAGDPLLIFRINAKRPRMGAETGLLLGAFLFNLVFDYAGPRYSSLLSRFQNSLREIIGPLLPRDIFILAVLSAFGEELFFRGAVQASLGFIPATLLFAASHYPLKKELWLWPLYALLMGSVLGTLRILGGDIWSAVLLHFSVNAVSLGLISGKSRK